MKTRVLLALMTITLFSCNAEEDNEAKKDVLKNVMSDYYNAMAKKDLEKMKTLTTVDFIMFDEGAVYNNESAVRSMEQMDSFTATFKFDNLNIHFDKAHASAYYFREANFVIKETAQAPMKFLESATFEKRDGKWKLRFLHSSIRR